MPRVLRNFEEGTPGDPLPDDDTTAGDFGRTYVAGSGTYASGRGGVVAHLTDDGIGTGGTTGFYQLVGNSPVRGVGAFVKPTENRSAVQVYWNSDSGSPIIEFLFRDADHAGNLYINSIGAGGVPDINLTVDLDQWFDASLGRDGQWSIKGESSVIASGTIAMSVPDGGRMGVDVFALQGEDAQPAGACLADDIYIFGDSCVRMFPRDDGRGMSSAPRIHPIPRGTSRIIGGFQ